ARRLARSGRRRWPRARAARSERDWRRAEAACAVEPLRRVGSLARERLRRRASGGGIGREDEPFHRCERRGERVVGVGGGPGRARFGWGRMTGVERDEP